MATATMNWEDVDVEVDEESQVLPETEKYSPEQEATIKVFAQDFFGDVKALARQYMEQFFGDKMLHCGGKIPKSFLFADRRVSMVLNYDIIKGVERAYKSLEDTLDPQEVKQAQQTGEATSDIRLVNETLRLLSRSGIPQQFAGGMMCLYLEFIEGVDIGTEP